MQDTFFNIDSIFPKRALFSAPAYSFVVGRTAEVADARVLSLSLANRLEDGVPAAGTTT